MNYLSPKYLCFYLVALSMLLIASCQKDNSNSELNSNQIESAAKLQISPEELNLNEYVNEIAVHSKAVAIPNSSTKKLGVESLELTLKSANPEVLNLIEIEWFKFEYNPISEESEETVDGKSNSQSVISNHTLHRLDAESNVLIIQVEGWNVNNSFDVESESPISLEFDEEMKAVMTDNNIQLLFYTNYDNITNNRKAFRWMTYMDKAWVRGADRTYGYYYYTNYNNTSPSYYHSYKYFSDNSYYLPYHTDVVAVCCYNSFTPWKTMKYVYTSGYIYGISWDANFCLRTGSRQCYKG